MAESLLIRLTSNGALRDWAIVDDEGQCRDGVHGAGEAPASAAAGRRVEVLVPAEDVHLCRARVPGRNRQRVLRAIPYALEEQLADEVESLHFAIGPAAEDGDYPVAVVARARMNGWLESLQDMGLAPDRLLPDALALPLADDAWSLLVDGDRALVRRDAWNGFALDTALLPGWFELLAGREEAPPRVRVFGDAAVDLGVIEVEREDTGGAPPLAILARGRARTEAIDLLQGSYGRREELGRLLRPWRATAVLLAAGLLLFLVSTGIDYYRLSRENDRLAAEIEQLYRRTFPDAKRVVNARAQMEQRLKSLRRRAGQAGADFFGLLGETGKVLQQTPGIQVRGVNYRDGRLDLELTADNLQVLDRLKQKLVAGGRLAAEIQSATSEGGQKVKSRVRVQGVRS